MGLARRSARGEMRVSVRERDMTTAVRRFVEQAVGFVLAVLLVVGAPVGALAADRPESPLEVAGPDSIQLARIDIIPLPVQTTPLSIETGIPCGMEEMCGLDPCLCGAVDQWGACACNGTEETHPTLSFLPDREGIVGSVEFFDTTYLIALGEGSTDATVRAELPHHEVAETSMRVDVAPFGFADLLKVMGALLVVAGVCAAVFFGARALIRVFVRLIRQVGVWQVQKGGAASGPEGEGAPEGDPRSDVSSTDEDSEKKGK